MVFQRKSKTQVCLFDILISNLKALLKWFNDHYAQLVSKAKKTAKEIGADWKSRLIPKLIESYGGLAKISNQGATFLIATVEKSLSSPQQTQKTSRKSKKRQFLPVTGMYYYCFIYLLNRSR